MAACICDMSQNTQAHPLNFPSTFSDLIDDVEGSVVTMKLLALNYSIL
jgi:hypothetical protein